MPSEDVNALRDCLQRRYQLVQQLTDAQAVEAIRAEVIRLKERIGRLETKPDN